jgi:hypothetical protein
MSQLNWKGRPYRPVGGTGYIRVYKPDINDLMKPLSQKSGLGSAILTGNVINPVNLPTTSPVPSVTPSPTPTNVIYTFQFSECITETKFVYSAITTNLSIGQVYYITGGTGFNGYASVVAYSGTGTFYSANGVTFTAQGACPTPTMTPTPSSTPPASNAIWSTETKQWENDNSNWESA